MPSIVEIIKRLMEGGGSSSTGHPNAYDDMRELYEFVTSRIPEFKGMSMEEVEEKVFDAIQEVESKFCKAIKGAEVEPETPDYYEDIVVYQCSHPEIGQFYLTIEEEGDSSSGYGYLGFGLTRDRRKALEGFREKIREWRENGIRFESF